MDKKMFEEAVQSLANSTGKTLEESKQLLLSVIDAFKNGYVVTTEK